jgi:twitching motility protein PilT
MRDADTVRAALSAAETGHFVMSTLHTTDAKETVNRVIDFFPPFEQKQVRLALAASLQGIVCQRLVPRADGAGRVVAMEVAVNTPRLAEAIADPDRTDSMPDIVADGAYSGMQTFDQHLVRLVLDGSVSVQDAKVVSTNTHDFGVMLKRAGVDPALVDAEPPR